MRTIRRMAQKIAAEPRDPERRESEKSPPSETSALTHALQRNHSQLDRKFSIFQPVIALLFCNPASIGIADVQHTARIPLHPHRLMHCAAQDSKSGIAATVIQTGDAPHVVARLGEMRNASTA